MARGAAGEPTANRANVDEADEEEDPLVRRREEVIRLLRGQEASAKLLTLCAKLEAKNEKNLPPLPPELWEKIVDASYENLDQYDLLAFAMTCRFFREKQKDLGKKVKKFMSRNRLLELRESGKMTPHTFDWFRWVCDTIETLPGFIGRDKRVKGDLLDCAVFQGSVEILRWLIEEKGWELNEDTDTGWWAGQVGNIEVLEHLRGKGYKFDRDACDGAARGGCLEALRFLRGLDPPCPWSDYTCAWAALEGHLDVLKWLKDQDPPCPWDERTCSDAAMGGHLEVLKWLRSQDPPCPWNRGTCFEAAWHGHLDVLKWLRSQDPPCPWSRTVCREQASRRGHEHIVDWIDQQRDESDWED